MGDWTVSVTPTPVIDVSVLITGKGVGLAGQSSSKDVHQPAKKRKGKLCNVAAPYRVFFHALFFHPGQVNGVGVGFPFRTTNNPGTGDNELNGFVEHPDAAAN